MNWAGTSVVDRRHLLQAAALLAVGLPTRSKAAGPMHIVLLGDSSFDNAAYVAPGDDVLAKLQARLPAGAEATLAAVDGGVIRDLERQLRAVPAGATHLVVSVGGNDALARSGILQEPARSVAEVLDRLSGIRETFLADYRAMLDAVLARRLPTAVATIYEARFPEPAARRIGATALAVLNDLIIREAAVRGLPLLDWRSLFSDDADYANAIEPSARGGEKIAGAIASLVAEHDFGTRRSEIFAR
jgi:lysophospholipase L1-like esterase